MNRPASRRAAVAATVATLALGGLAACSSSGTSPAPASPSPSPSPTQTSSPTGNGNSTVVFDEMIQEQLRKVGCYQGNIDGILGPATDAAIVAFQQAQGLHVDGELGPQTDTALKAAAQGGVTVCSGSPTATASPSPTHGKASCTATAIAGALGGVKLISYVCADVAAERWAAGQEKDGPGVVNFFLKAEGTTWRQVPQDEVCGTASAGLPDSITQYCGEA